MTGTGGLLIAAAAVLAAAYLPGFAIVRALGGSRLLGLGLAPALGAGIAGLAALAAPLVGLRWSVLPFLLAALAALGAAALAARLGLRLPGTVLDGELMPGASRTLRLGGGIAVLAALAVALVPIARAGGRSDVVLERWDTLYHLSALQRIRETGTASSLDLGSVSNTAAEPTAYPAAFHALAALVPGVPVPVLLNGAVLALAVVPWVLGTALLARAVFPQVRWAPLAAALGAALIPASPLDLWIHLSPVPNLAGFAALTGALAAVVALWAALGPRPAEGTRSIVRPVLTALALVGLAGIGLALLHPNVAVTALILVAVLTAATTAGQWRRRPLLLVLPALCLLPVAVLSWTPLGAGVTGFVGGLQVPWWMALGEVLLGLLTVWPMALGVVLAVLWWPGLVVSWRSPQRWVVIAWAVIAVIYLDAAVDSPANLSTLWYRGQDRLSMPLAMLSVLLMVPGLRWWGAMLARTGTSLLRRPLPVRPAAAVLVALAAVAALTSLPSRSDAAARNLAAEYGTRGRFLQADELAAWEQAAPTLDPEQKVLASPFSGASHMYALQGQDVYFPVAGITLSTVDRNLIRSVPLAATNPENCANFTEYGIGYVYLERRQYAWDDTFAPLAMDSPALDALGPTVFETPHSRLIEIDCDDGS